jgi:hypothetical protein
MKSYRACYKKKSGELREIHFAKISDLPKDFVENKIKGASKQHELDEGRELVWDLEISGFRVFNWKTVEGAVKEEEVSL